MDPRRVLGVASAATVGGAEFGGVRLTEISVRIGSRLLIVELKLAASVDAPTKPDKGTMSWICGDEPLHALAKSLHIGFVLALHVGGP